MTANADTGQTATTETGDGQRQQGGHMPQLLRDLADDLTRPGIASWPPVPYTPAGAPPQLGGHEAGWVPRTDVFEQDGELVVRAELPGVKKEDLHVSPGRGTLTIGGERQGAREVRAHDYYIREGTFGSFERRLALRFPVQASQVKAAFTDGVLELRLPLPSQEKPQPQAIPIS
jgi:HSP20 family protein